MPSEIRGEVDEPFRETLYRAFRAAAIPEIELARRLGLPSQAAAHQRLRRDASVTERKLRESARALGYRVQLTLVPIAQGEAHLPAESAEQALAPQADFKLTHPPRPDERPKKPRRRRKDATE